MFEKQVTFIDFFGKPHVELLRFHMMVPEYADLEFDPNMKTSFSDLVRESMTSGDNALVYALFKMLVVKSYGRVSDDGVVFRKKDEWTDDFMHSNAWDQFFIWLTDDPTKNGTEFYNGIFPESMRHFADAAAAQAQEAGTPKKELTEMSREDLLALLEKKPANE